MTSSKTPLDRLIEMEHEPRNEGGGWYCHKSVPTYKRFIYRWFHVPTSKHGETEVFCPTERDFLKVLCAWQRDEWFYSPLTSGEFWEQRQINQGG